MAISHFDGIGPADALYYGDKPTPKTLVGKELYKAITGRYDIHIMEHTKCDSQVWIVEAWTWYTAGRFSFENPAIDKAINSRPEEQLS